MIWQHLESGKLFFFWIICWHFLQQHSILKINAISNFYFSLLEGQRLNLGLTTFIQLRRVKAEFKSISLCPQVCFSVYHPAENEGWLNGSREFNLRFIGWGWSPVLEGLGLYRKLGTHLDLEGCVLLGRRRVEGDSQVWFMIIPGLLGWGGGQMWQYWGWSELQGQVPVDRKIISFDLREYWRINSLASSQV